MANGQTTPSGAQTYKTLITVLLTVISLLLTYFGVESRTNRDDITEIKIKRSAEQEHWKKIEADVAKIASWVEKQQAK